MRRVTADALTFVLSVFWVWAPPPRGQGRTQQAAGKFLRASNPVPDQFVAAPDDDTPDARHGSRRGNRRRSVAADSHTGGFGQGGRSFGRVECCVSP